MALAIHTVVRHQGDANGSMTTICADELQPGDVVEYDGGAQHVTHADRRNGWAWPVAFDDTGWQLRSATI